VNVFLRAVRSTRLNRARLQDSQEKVSTGKQFGSVADDPGSVSRVLDLKGTRARIDQFGRSIESSRAALENTDAALSTLSNALIRLRELTVSADVEEADFDKIQPEVEQIFSELIQIANTRVGDRYIFGGFLTDSAPVTQTGTFGDPAPIVAYNGDSGQIFSQIDESQQILTNETARRVFFGSTDADETADGQGVSLFDVVQTLRNSLDDPQTNGRPVESLDELDRALDQVLQARGRVGARLSRLDTTGEQLEALDISIETERSSLEDVDLVDAIIELQSREQTLQASLGVTARIIQPTLLNFLG
jgi:flagellar hook-associated protein 3 FlgL